MEEEDGPEDCSSKLLSIPFVEVFRSTFCSNDVFALNKVSEEIILNEVSLGASPAINFALLLSNTDRPEAPQFVGDARGVTDAVISCYRNGTAPLL